MPSSDLTQYFFNMESLISSYEDNAAAICLQQDMALEGPYSLTLDGYAVTDGVATFNSASRVKIVSGGGLSTVTYTITGTDVDGNPLVESILGPTAEAEVSFTTNYFKTVTEIEVTDGDGSEILGTVGIADGGAVRVFEGAGRIRSIYYSPDGSGSTPVIFYKNAIGGAVGFAYVPKDNVGGNILFPDMGIRFPDSCYLVWPNNSAFRSLSVMVS